MKRLTNVYFIGILALMGCNTEVQSIRQNQTVPFTEVQLNDNFWAPKIEKNRTVSIPSAFHQCEINGRIDNFALAGDKIMGEHKGDFPFDDTDVYKVIEGASYSLAVQYDAQLDAYLDSVISLIAIAQEPDGYLTTCITNRCERLRPWYGKGKWDRLNSHELYNSGHLYEAAVAHYQATGKRNLLDIAIKNADMICQVFGPGEDQKKVPSGHPIVEMALVKLYNATNEERYLHLAKFFIDETGKGTDGHRLNAYSQDHMPIVEQDEAVGHAVRLGYLYSGVTDVASLLNDSALMAASKRVWENVVSKKLYITGGIGSRAQGEGFGSNYELNNMTAYCETCASIANVYWNYRLFLNEANSSYYDVLERVLYNGVISGVSLSGDKFFYDNPLESDSSHNREHWFGCACCPGNVTRFMASVPGYIYTTSEKSILINLFAANDAQIAIGSDTVLISQKTNYPWEGKVEIEVKNTPSKKLNLMVRVPGWATNHVVPSDLYRFITSSQSPIVFMVNGKKENPKIRNGYASFTKRWKQGDIIEVNLPMEIQKIVSHTAVDANKGKIAYQRGPLVYCFEDKDNNSWLFDTYITPEANPEAKFETDLLGGVTAISINGYKVAKGKTEAVSLKAIPYFAWNNRGAANMAVWMAESEQFVYSKNGRGKEMEAKAFSSSDWVPGLNDGFEPRSSSDIDKHFFTWWSKKANEKWVEYQWEKPVTLSQTGVYWLQTNHYEGNYRMPKSWTLQYKSKAGKWMDVKTADALTTVPDQFNTVNFEEVTTTAIRLNVEAQTDCSAGILEWRVK